MDTFIFADGKLSDSWLLIQSTVSYTMMTTFQEVQKLKSVFTQLFVSFFVFTKPTKML